MKTFFTELCRDVSSTGPSSRRPQCAGRGRVKQEKGDGRQGSLSQPFVVVEARVGFAEAWKRLQETIKHDDDWQRKLEKSKKK